MNSNKSITDATNFLNNTEHRGEIAPIMGFLYNAHRSNKGITTEVLNKLGLDADSKNTLETNLRTQGLLS